MPGMMTPEPASSGDIKLDGALTIRSAESVRAHLLAALYAHHALRIDCTAASEVDLSCVQLGLSTRRSAAATGKSLALAAPADGALLDVLVRAGLVDPTGQEPLPDQAFWLNQEARDGEDHPHGR